MTNQTECISILNWITIWSVFEVCSNLSKFKIIAVWVFKEVRTVMFQEIQVSTNPHVWKHSSSPTVTSTYIFFLTIKFHKKIRHLFYLEYSVDRCTLYAYILVSLSNLNMIWQIILRIYFHGKRQKLGSMSSAPPTPENWSKIC